MTLSRLSRRSALALPQVAIASAARAQDLRQPLRDGMEALRRASAHRGTPKHEFAMGALKTHRRSATGGDRNRL